MELEAAIAQWICLHLLSCGVKFKSQAHNLCFYQKQSNSCYVCLVKRTKMNNKRPGLAQLKNSSRQMPTKIGPKKLYNTGPLNLGELINTTLKTFKFSRELFLAFFRRSQFSTLFKSESDNLKPSINVKERKA